MKPPLSAAVVIACHTERRWNLLLNAMASARAQRVAPTEVIVVVDHNPALFRRLRATVETRPGITVVENELLPGASGARNTGAFIADAALVAFLDDDACAQADWLGNVLRPFADPTVVGTGGRVVPDWASDRPSWFPAEFDWVVGASYLGMPSGTTTVRNVWAENMAVRRDVFDAVGGFRTGFGKLGAHSRPEDTDLCIRMAAAGGRWMYCADAVVSHYVPAERSSYSFFVRRTYHEGRGKAEMARLLPPGAPALASERDYVRRTLPAGVARYSRRALRARSGGDLGRAVSIVVGLAATVWGFAVQKVIDRAAPPAAELVDSPRVTGNASGLTELAS